MNPVNTYSKREEKLNFATHLAATAAAVAGSAFMLWKAESTGDAGAAAAAGIFSFFLVLAYLSSALYHGLEGGAKAAFKKLDHISILLMIAGMYTALAVLSDIPRAWIAPFAAAMWAGAAFGTALKLKAGTDGTKAWSLGLYVSMSLAVVVLFPFLKLETALFLLSAGAVDGVGILFYVRKDRQYTHAVWHLFSTAAGVLDYLAVLSALP